MSSEYFVLICGDLYPSDLSKNNNKIICNCYSYTIKGISIWLETLFFILQRSGWVECWTVPSVMLTIDYTWHPIYPQKADEQLKQSRKSFYIINLYFETSNVMIDSHQIYKKGIQIFWKCIIFWHNYIHLKCFKDLI